MTPLTAAPRLGRPPLAQRRVLDAVRGRILRGDWGPGDRLPSRRALSARYGIGLPAVQEAIEQLTRDGFVESRGALGSFITARPPHLFRFVLALDAPLGEASSIFRQSLAREAQRLTATGPLRVDVMENLQDHVSHRGYERLCEDLRRRRVAGLILPSTPPISFRGTPLLDEPGVRRVALQSGDDPDIDAQVELDQRSMIDRALDALQAAGCRRIGVVRASWDASLQHHLVSEARRRGMTLPEHWDQQVSLRYPDSARNICHLLFHPDHRHARPDGLFIADDNLVEPCTLGLTAAGVRGDGDVRLVAHSNFPWPSPTTLPIHRVGFDVRQVMAALVQLAGRPADRSAPHAGHVRISAVDQSQVAASEDFLSFSAPARQSTGVTR